MMKARSSSTRDMQSTSFIFTTPISRFTVLTLFRGVAGKCRVWMRRERFSSVGRGPTSATEHACMQLDLESGTICRQPDFSYSRVRQSLDILLWLVGPKRSENSPLNCALEILLLTCLIDKSRTHAHSSHGIVNGNDIVGDSIADADCGFYFFYDSPL